MYVQIFVGQWKAPIGSEVISIECIYVTIQIDCQDFFPMLSASSLPMGNVLNNPQLASSLWPFWLCNEISHRQSRIVFGRKAGVRGELFSNISVEPTVLEVSLFGSKKFYRDLS